jgi:ectoine hydroxylase-related dioxygenase (phytanoyl-CoA dioxygenase family)
MPVPHLAADAAVDEIADALAREGVAIVDRLVEPAVMDRARGEIAQYLDATPFGADDFAGRRTRRTGGLIGRSPTCRDLIQHPSVLGAARRVLDKATSIQVHLTQLIAIGPGEPAQAVHRDQWAFDFFPFPAGYEVQCNTIWAMTDFTAENGATRIVPGSHRLEDRLQFAEKDTEPAEMEKGSVLLYTGSVYHAGGANRSGEIRLGLNLTYVVSWLRQEENQYLSVPLEVARTLPTDLLRLMGYARGAYALGYVDDGRDPLEVVRPGASVGGLGDPAASLEQARSKLRRAGARDGSRGRREAGQSEP